MLAERVNHANAAAECSTEPGTYAMLLAGLGLAGLASRRKRHKAVA
ncbi:MAG: PEP-CTERM sorting domain-containing protein [Burkholderiales bacterium]